MTQDTGPLPNAVFMEISVDEEGRLLFSGGFGFDDDYPEDTMQFLQDLLAGVYAIINTQTDNVIAAGKIVRSAPGFDGFDYPEQEETDVEIIFEPDEELVKKMKERSQDSTLNVIKFDPKKHRKH
jgi:hypothetical protein